MAETYGSPERATLLVLMLNGGELPNAELRKDHGVDLSPAGRAKLNKAGLLETRKEGRRLVHRITRAGEDWCEEALADIETPPRSNPLVRICFEVLRLYARHNKVRLGDLIGSGSKETLEEMIRRVYQELSSKPQEWVRLAVLRPKLNGAEKDEVDQTLLGMTKTGLVHLSPDSDRRGLTDADHAAAIRIAKEDKHFVLIEES
jgi:DNA-binding PadR family transcriptional regulator